MGATIMLLRAGCKLHLQKYVQLPDDATDPPTRPILEPLLARVSALPPVKKYAITAATYRGFDSQEVTEQRHYEEQAAKAAAKAAAAEAEAARAAEAAARAQEGGEVKEEPQAGQQAAAAAPPAPPQPQQQQPKQEAGPPTVRPPCMWMLLTPVRDPGEPRPAGAAAGDIALPIHIDPGLPDFLMPASTYEERVRKSWVPGERFRMYFGGKHGTKVRRGRPGRSRWQSVGAGRVPPHESGFAESQRLNVHPFSAGCLPLLLGSPPSLRSCQPDPHQVGGAYYKGTITGVVTPQNHSGPGDFDPWESITVHWDNEENSVNKVGRRGQTFGRLMGARGPFCGGAI
jgi:hypothetical protein